MNGGAGDDEMRGNSGTDTIIGGIGNDSVFGGSGNDLVFGNEGNDLLVGQSGADTLNGGLGDDTQRGGAGADLFVFAEGFDQDVIEDFNVLEGDRLRFKADPIGGLTDGAAILAAFADDTSGEVVFDFGNGDQVTLLDVQTVSELAGTIEVF
jgi:serralysin